MDGQCIFRVFWPKRLCEPIKESGYLVGWSLGSGVVVVASKVGFANTEQVKGYLSEFQHRQDLADAVIVGYLSREGEGLCEMEPRDRSPLWIDAFTARTQVAFRDVLAFGMVVPGRVIVTVYDESINEPWHYYLASPITLDLTQPHTTSPQTKHIPLQYILDHVNTAKTLYTHIHGDPPQTEHGQSAESRTSWLSNAFVSCSSWVLRASDVSVMGMRVTKVSAVGQQLDMVVRRGVYAVEQWQAKSYTRRGPQGPHNAQYASFWNSAFAALLDVILGCI
ncbi:hypothetical protein EV180_006853, partial [Coemansia sp. RSA 518]